MTDPSYTCNFEAMEKNFFFFHCGGRDAWKEIEGEMEIYEILMSLSVLNLLCYF